MDVLLSLPLVSYFLAPSLTSWSTSLNLLFFYMTWTTLVLSHPPVRIEIVGVTAIRLVLWLFPSLVFLLFDLLLPSLAESVKFGGARALPPRDGAFLARTASLALLNVALETVVEAGASLSLASALHGPLFTTATTLPLPWQIIRHLGILVVSREVLTYYIHRFVLHNPQAAAAVKAKAKQVAGSRKGGAGGSSASTRNYLALWHVGWGHARAAPPFSLALGSSADHPLAFLLHRFVPLYLPAAVLRPHLLTYFLFVALVSGEETLATSGYTAVPGIIMGGIARRTAVHYASAGRATASSPAGGNYGAWGFLDWLHGTSLGRDVVADIKDEADKHHLKEKGEQAGADAASLVQSGVEELRQRSGRRTRSQKAQ